MLQVESDKVTLITYDSKYAVDAVAMWRDSKERALGVREIHSFESHVDFLNQILNEENTVYLAIRRNRESVVGLMATDGVYINQLYIHIDYQRMGIGERFLRLAKTESSGRLRLRTFDINSGARTFYEKHGFEIIGHGCDNEENLPDILYEWRGH